MTKVQNGNDYYNKEQQTNNKLQYISNESLSIPLGRTSSLNDESLVIGTRPTEEGEPLDSGASEEAPLGPHNVKRALIQLFCNDDGTRKLKVRVNLTDGENADFIAPLQKYSNLTSYLRHTGEYKNTAREWFTSIRKYCKNTYGIKPQTGKFHLVTHKYTAQQKSIQVEPDCYGSIVYEREERIYFGFVKLYDLMLSEIDLFDGNLTPKQRSTGVRGQYLWINPRYDDRVRNKTFAQQRKEGTL